MKRRSGSRDWSRTRTRSSRRTTRSTTFPRTWRSTASTGCAGTRRSAPDKPFFLYWAPGAGHGPHQIFKEWADKYKGKFDSGWDAYRERVFERQKQMGWIPADTKLTPRADNDAVVGQHPGSSSAPSSGG